uniref:DUF5117 domain-containing protein n=1 Tax=uncultured bacterium contig00003(2014) TaxID=1465624 RepID=A0A060D222_9BACT|nr:hypothetical protein [uncultured bacterium contig00003(2014)]
MKKTGILFLAAILWFSALQVRAQSLYGGFFDEIKGLVTAKSDFITLRCTTDKLWFEIPVKYMDREMLIASTLSDISSPSFGDIGNKAKPPMHIRFTLQDTMVHMRQINTRFTTDFARQALERVNTDPILNSYPVQAWGPDSTSVVVEMTDLLLDNPAFFDFFKQEAIAAAAPTFKKESSWFDEIKAFADNLAVKSVLTFSVTSDAGETPVTARVTRSILLLPEDKMTPRIADSRVGIFTTDKLRFTDRLDGAKPYSVANRWRMVPSDPQAYARGELVEPTKPIVWYIDSDFPELWKAPIRKGIEDWIPAFEAIGFKNAIQVRDFPTPEQDPDFDPDNLRYSCVRYLPSSVSNAMGPSWVDPATGEIINASVIVWSNVIELINKWRFVQTAQIDPRVRNKKMPDDVVTESMRYVIAHEVGHTLGFPHNMGASSAWPVDSLRSAAFTQKYGTTPSIMDYARQNYVAQPTDHGVRLTPPDLGVYDYYAVRWTYRYLPQFTDEWDEQATVESWVDAVAGDSVYRYGRQQMMRYDPSSIEEDLGDDPIRAGDYGIANLKYILSHLEEWITDDADYLHRLGLYTELNGQYLRYIENVMINIGGLYLTQVKEGTRGEAIVPVPKATQRASLRWVMDQYRNMDWLDNASLKRHFPLGVSGSSDVRDKVANDFKAQIVNVVLSSYYSDSPYTVREFMDDLYAETWANVLARRASTAGERALQRTMVAMFTEPLAADSGSSEEVLQEFTSRSGDRFGPAGMGFQSEVNISAIDDSAVYLIDLAVRSRDLLYQAISRSRGEDKAHYQALLIGLNDALKDKL